jgi:hypothetical protein
MPGFVQPVIDVKPSATVPVLRGIVRVLRVGAEHVFPDVRFHEPVLFQAGCRVEQFL